MGERKSVTGEGRIQIGQKGSKMFLTEPGKEKS